MGENAFVCWIPFATPWDEEATLIQRLSLPLNIAGNTRHPYCAELSARRQAARIFADTHPVLRSG
jgi:hypothetical protein